MFAITSHTRLHRDEERLFIEATIDCETNAVGHLTKLIKHKTYSLTNSKTEKISSWTNCGKVVVFLFCFFCFGKLQSQKISQVFTKIIPEKWNIPSSDSSSYSFEKYDSSEALILRKPARLISRDKIQTDNFTPLAYVKGFQFKDGIIEADLASPNGGGFIGLAFRIKDERHYETVYFRPSSSHTSEAMQYMPRIKGEFNYWKYQDHEHQAYARIPFKKWFHVKLVIKGIILNVFVNDMENPIFTYNNLDSSLDNGSVGFWLGGVSGAYKNLMIKDFN